MHAPVPSVQSVPSYVPTTESRSTRSVPLTGTTTCLEGVMTWMLRCYSCDCFASCSACIGRERSYSRRSTSNRVCAPRGLPAGQESPGLSLSRRELRNGTTLAYT
jgi:hypothetical protein